MTAGLSIVHNAGKQKLDHEIAKSIQTIEQTREEAYIQFHPNVEEGRKKLQQYWEAHHASVLQI